MKKKMNTKQSNKRNNNMNSYHFDKYGKLLQIYNFFIGKCLEFRENNYEKLYIVYTFSAL